MYAYVYLFIYTYDMSVMIIYIDITLTRKEYICADIYQILPSYSDIDMEQDHRRSRVSSLQKLAKVISMTFLLMSQKAM